MDWKMSTVWSSNQVRKYYIIGLILLITTTAGVGGYLIGTKKNSKNVTQPIQVNNQKPTPSLDNKTIRIYPSLDSRLFFYMYPVEGGSEECHYGIVNKSGYSIHDPKKLLNKETIHCVEGIGGLSGAFQKWASDDKFIVKDNEGQIKIVDLKNSKVSNFQYDSKLLGYIGVNNALKYWLFTKNPDNHSGGSYVLMDSNKKIINDDLNFDTKYSGTFGFYTVLYDDVNDGFLFIMRNYSGEEVSNKFDFLSLKDLSYRTLLTTSLTKYEARGCGTNELESKLGEIIFLSDCIIVSDQYKQPDGRIHIRL